MPSGSSPSRTESKVIFLQQIGRGLRSAEGKTRLLVIDFVGNHRLFAQRMIHLLSLGGKDASWSDFKKWIGGENPDLPAGCLLDVELEARDILAQFIPTSSKAGLETYRVLRDELGRRPHAAELFAHGILPKTVSKVAGSWFEFVEAESDLTVAEQNVLSQFLGWLKTVETTKLNKSYKMVVLRVLLDNGDLFNGVDLAQFSQRCRRFMLQHPVLSRDLLEGKHAVDHRNAPDDEWAKWWREWPVDRWLDVQNGGRWFSLEGAVLRFAVDCPKHLRDALEAMTEELVDWRLAAYSKSRRLVKTAQSETAFEAKVSHAGGRPILFLPDKTKQPDRPVGPVEVLLPDGKSWEFKFAKIACNVAKPMGGKKNELSQLLRSWFGDNAGLPGTDYKVVFEKIQGQWHVRPLDVKPQSINTASEPSVDDKFELAIKPTVAKRARYKTHVPVCDLVAAAGGWGEEGSPKEIGWIRVADETLSEGMFVAKVVGQSMEPKISSESWCLFRPCPVGSRQNRLLLVQINTHLDPVDGGRYTVKKYHSEKHLTDDGWEHQTIELIPLNPQFSAIKISAEDATDLRVIGEFVKVMPSS